MVMLVSNSLTNSCLVNLIDVTLACEDANSKLVEVVSVADVDDEGRVGNSLSTRFGQDFDVESEDVGMLATVCYRFGS